jgi:hypothetical protein
MVAFLHSTLLRGGLPCYHVPPIPTTISHATTCPQTHGQLPYLCSLALLRCPRTHGRLPSLHAPCGVGSSTAKCPWIRGILTYHHVSPNPWQTSLSLPITGWAPVPPCVPELMTDFFISAPCRVGSHAAMCTQTYGWLPSLHPLRGELPYVSSDMWLPPVLPRVSGSAASFCIATCPRTCGRLLYLHPLAEWAPMSPRVSRPVTDFLLSVTWRGELPCMPQRAPELVAGR